MQFNDTKDTVEERTRTTNFEGGEAFDPDSPQMALYKVTINNLLEDTFYQDDRESLEQVIERFVAAADDDAEFPLQLASYARDEMGLRDISQLLLVLSSYHDAGKQYVDEWATDIILRADEPATIVAMHDYLTEQYGSIDGHTVPSTIPAPLRRGINDALHQFDGYQFAKYDSDRRQVNLRDVLNRTHPEPQDDEHEELFERLMLGELDDHPEVDPLEPPETWEVVISEQGNNEEAWRSVIDRMGMFAKIRNVRNMKEAGLDGEEILDDDDLEYVQDSRMFPFRFYQSYKAVKKAGVADTHIEDWLSQAIDFATDNLPDDLENTFVAADTSGSMRSPVSNKSNLQMDEIATLFAAALKRKGARAGAFADSFKELSCHHRTPTFEIQDKLNRLGVGGGTDGRTVFRYLIKNDIAVDRIVFLTDMQMWGDNRGLGRRGSAASFKQAFEDYKEEVNEDAALYMIDLQSYGDLKMPEGYQNVFRISGWNSRIINFIEYAERPGQILDVIGDRRPGDAR